MRLKIKKLSLRELDSVMEIYATTYAEDTYYCRAFKTSNCYADIYRNFRDDVQNAILSGYAYGAFVDGYLRGTILACNIFDWQNNNRRAFDHLMGMDTNYTACWINTVQRKLRLLDSKSIYIFQMAVLPEYQNMLIGTKLLNYVVRKFGRKYVLFSDLSSKLADSMWYKQGFKRENLEGDVRIVYRE